ncbi:MAG: HEAT repeat domain-containing protein [Bryobacteraceae bacterium]|nr:HEAT repeat domain-containing protein [Bryobacteraceae bacterium]
MICRFVVLSSAAVLLCAQQPAISNADIRQITANSGLEQAIRSVTDSVKSAAWIGYAVPTIPGDQNSCCWNDNGRGCGLEGERRRDGVTSNPGPVKLEGPTHVVILQRFEPGTAEKLRVFSPDCPLDAGGLAFYWVSNVKASESVSLLTRRAVRDQENGVRSKISEAAVHAIAMHAGPEAQAALIRFANDQQSESTRKSALFWLGSSRGKEGYSAVLKAVREDPSDKVREHAVFALMQSKEPEAIPEILRIAKADKATGVRKRAMFWLAQSRDRRAVEFFEQVLNK